MTSSLLIADGMSVHRRGDPHDRGPGRTALWGRLKAKVPAESGSRSRLCYGSDMLVVDPWHWLNQDGSLPCDQPGLFRKALRIAQVIEYGGTLARGTARDTLLQCTRRPARKRCTGLLWVTRTPNDELVAFCTVCKHDEVMVHNWQDTVWADGMMEAMSLEPEVEPSTH